MSKKLVICKNNSKLATSRKVKGESSPDTTHESGTINSNTSRDRENVEEGSHITNRASGWGAFEQYFLGREKRWRKPACGELKIPKPVHFISAFQSRRFVLSP